MSIEILDESGSGLDVKHFSKLARFVMDQMRVHPLAELCIKAVDEATIAHRLMGGWEPRPELFQRLVSIDTGTAQLWLAVNDIGILEQQAVGLDRLQVTGRGLWWMRAAPAEPLGRLRRCERLSLELWVRASREDAARLPDLGLVPSHARYWADVRDDNERYAPPENRIETRKPLWDEPPWPLAVESARRSVTVVSGGVACILGVAALVRWVPDLARYDAVAEPRRSDG